MGGGFRGLSGLLLLIITGGGLLARSTNMTVLSAVEAADRFRGKKDTIVNTGEGEAMLSGEVMFGLNKT